MRFQQDNALIHTARSVKSWINAQKVEILEWPPYFPDLNIKENVRGWLAKKVFESGKQYTLKAELIEGIKQVWSSIQLDFIKKLDDSILDRIFGVIIKKGGSTNGQFSAKLFKITFLIIIFH